MRGIGMSCVMCFLSVLGVLGVLGVLSVLGVAGISGWRHRRGILLLNSVLAATGA